MGCGSWTRDSYVSYSTTKGMSVSTDGMISGSYSNQDMFKAKTIDSALDPKNVIRECCDTEEHPNTIPVILALDVTGSMGRAAVEVAKKLNVIMTKLYEKVTDVEFLIMGIGDLACDSCPIQASQFGGGGNSYESYTAAWYFGSRHTKLDCLNRGRKGIIITMGDEQLNPYLPLKGYRSGLIKATGDNLQADVETKDLYNEASQKFNIYHLDVAHRHRWDEDEVEKSYKKYLDDTHFRRVNMNSITNEIVDIIVSEAENNVTDTVATPSSSEGITW